MFSFILHKSYFGFILGISFDQIKGRIPDPEEPLIYSIIFHCGLYDFGIVIRPNESIFKVSFN